MSAARILLLPLKDKGTNTASQKRLGLTTAKKDMVQWRFDTHRSSVSSSPIESKHSDITHCVVHVSVLYSGGDHTIAKKFQLRARNAVANFLSLTCKGTVA